MFFVLATLISLIILIIRKVINFWKRNWLFFTHFIYFFFNYLSSSILFFFYRKQIFLFVLPALFFIFCLKFQSSNFLLYTFSLLLYNYVIGFSVFSFIFSYFSFTIIYTFKSNIIWYSKISLMFSMSGLWKINGYILYFI